jgi:hypothetical protein
MTMETAMDTPVGSRRAKAKCSFCGQVWFGDVAYCPYCGHPSASAPAGAPSGVPPREWAHAVEERPADAAPAPAPATATATATDELATPPADLPGMRWKAWRKPIVTAAAALAFVAIAIALKELAVTTPDRAASPRPEPARAPAIAAVTAPVAPNRGASASTAPAPRAKPVVPRVDVAPPAAHRSLCSAANEAAGLCKPQ